MTKARNIALMAALVGVGILGCGGGKPARMGVPAYDISGSSKQAMQMYDKDGDGALAGEELKEAKSLSSAMSRVDADKDGKITEDEIAKRLQRYVDFRAGLASVDCTLMQHGKPLANATITYEPEKFMGDSVPPGTGVTGDEGMAAITVSAEHLPGPRYSGMKPGFYRVRVKLADGTEVSKLDEGVECAGDFLSSHRIVVP